MTKLLTKPVSLTELKEGDKIIYGDRKQPCTVVKATLYDNTIMGVGRFEVKTPHGKTRILSRARTAGVSPMKESDKLYEATRPDSDTWVNYFDRLERVISDE